MGKLMDLTFEPPKYLKETQACLCRKEDLNAEILLDGQPLYHCLFADAEAGVVIVKELRYPDTSHLGKYPCVAYPVVCAKIGKVEIRRAF